MMIWIGSGETKCREVKQTPKKVKGVESAADSPSATHSSQTSPGGTTHTMAASSMSPGGSRLRSGSVTTTTEAERMAEIRRLTKGFTLQVEPHQSLVEDDSEDEDEDSPSDSN